MPKLTDFSNLMLAYKKARKGSGSTAQSEAFGFHLETELLALEDELKSGSYTPKPYRIFLIYEPKERIISVAPFKDRVVHHALINILEPIYERSFIYHSYATRKGKGNHAAITQAQQWARGYRCFFKADIEKYFDSIDHRILISLLEQKIKDQTFLGLMKKVIANGGNSEKGLPIGNLTSQFLANVYLNPLDHFIKQALRIHGYLRYMDDFVCFHNEKPVLKQVRKEIETYLKEKLFLRLKPSACYFGYSHNGLSFLGARIFPGMIRIKPENFHRARRRMLRKYRQMDQGEITFEEFLHSMNSYWAYLSSFDTLGLRQQMVREGF